MFSKKSKEKNYDTFSTGGKTSPPENGSVLSKKSEPTAAEAAAKRETSKDQLQFTDVVDPAASTDRVAADPKSGSQYPNIGVVRSKSETKAAARDRGRLGREKWLRRYGHSLTYAGIFLFTLTLYFRPYELIPALSGFSSMALVIAVVTLIIYLPTQFSVEGTPTVMTTEVKCVLFMTAWALITIPIAKSPAMAWGQLSDVYIKVAVIFVIMVNSLRTELRIKALLSLGIGVGVMLSYQALVLYNEGVFKTEGYRVSVDFGGMFGNPNDMSIHLVMFAPIALTLGIAARKYVVKAVLYAAAVMMVAGSFVTQSRGAFLGLVAMSAVLAWKIGRRHRIRTMLISAAVAAVAIALAPGNYGIRILSIFIPGLDPAGSSDQRTELLIGSIWVTLRNPFGIGIGNSPIVGVHELGTHNAYTQVSTELGILAFIAYLILLISPLLKLSSMERLDFARDRSTWIYWLAIGLQASIAGYMVSSFFSSVAYQWYVYYPISCAIGMRRIYQLAEPDRETVKDVRKGLEGLELQST